MKLKNKIALITGSSSGIGQGVAELFAKEGATVVVNYPAREETENANNTLELITSDSPDSITYMANVSLEDEVIRMVNSINEKLGTIDILVNNAHGTIRRKTFENTIWNEFSENMNGTIKGAHNCCQAVISEMQKKKWGRI